MCPFTCEGGEGGRLTLTGRSHSARLELRLEGDGPGGLTALTCRWFCAPDVYSLLGLQLAAVQVAGLAF